MSIEELQAMLAAFRNKAIAADACTGIAVEAWNDLAAGLLRDEVPTADQRFAASAGTTNAQRQLRELADQLGELGAAFDALLRTAAGEKLL